MAKKDSASYDQMKGQNKRLARAKAKAPEQDGKGAKKKDAGKAKAGKAKPAKKKLTLAEARSRRKKRVTAIIVVVFAALMALSMMLPSFSAIFANQSAQSSSEEQSDSSDTDSSDDESSDDTQDMSTVSGVDSSYEAVVEPLEEKLASDSDNLATLLALGNDYMSWGYQITQVGTTDDDTSHANELLAKAQSYYDQYLALNDSPMVRTNRALCQYYAGDTSGATTALEELTQSNPDFGPAWANLGLMYEVSGDTDKAKEAYNQAVSADSDDEYGAKSFAETRLSAISSSESQTDTSASSTSSSSSATGAQGLTDALNSGL